MANIDLKFSDYKPLQGQIDLFYYFGKKAEVNGLLGTSAPRKYMILMAIIEI